MPAQHKSEPGFLETFFRNIVGPFFIFLGSPVLYPLKKMFNAGRNILFRHTKRGRSLGRLIGIGISGYIGVSQGAAVGAAFGSVVLPGVGTVAGSLLGALIGAVIGGNIGALITKYVAKRLSELVYEDTNPDKWTLTLNQAVEMSQKVTSIQEIETPASPQPKNSPNKVSLSVVLRAMDAVDAAKKQTQGLGNIPGTLVRERKNKFNDLLEKIKNGKFDVRPPEEKEFCGFRVWLCPPPTPCGDASLLTSNNQHLFLYSLSNGKIFFYFNVNGKKTEIPLANNKQELGLEEMDFPDANTKLVDCPRLDPQNEAHVTILKLTAQKGYTGSIPLKPQMKMQDDSADKELIALYKQGLFNNNRNRATNANSSERNQKVRHALAHK